MKTDFFVCLSAVLFYLAIYLIVSALLRADGKHRELHARTLVAAKIVYKKLQLIDNDGAVISYLKQIEPFVFEELLLLAFKNKGYRIYRNKRYTGDGGLDGKVKINGHTYFIQAKRYSDYINPKHVQEFVMLCKERKVKGYFIHTGKTGEKSRDLISDDTVEIISGQKLIELIRNDKLKTKNATV